MALVTFEFLYYFFPNQLLNFCRAIFLSVYRNLDKKTFIRFNKNENGTVYIFIKQFENALWVTCIFIRNHTLISQGRETYYN